jgi:hypothetical protein
MENIIKISSWTPRNRAPNKNTTIKCKDIAVDEIQPNWGCDLGPYTETIDLWFEPFFWTETWRIIEWLREIKTADQNCYKFIIIQQNKCFKLNVN